jgi:hypothetical protein
MLFAFNNEIVLEIASIWLEVAGLGYHLDQQVPHARLCDLRSVRAQEQLLFAAAAD